DCDEVKAEEASQEDRCRGHGRVLSATTPTSDVASSKIGAWLDAGHRRIPGCARMPHAADVPAVFAKSASSARLTRSAPASRVDGKRRGPEGPAFPWVAHSASKAE